MLQTLACTFIGMLVVGGLFRFFGEWADAKRAVRKGERKEERQKGMTREERANEEIRDQVRREAEFHRHDDDE